VDSKYHNIRAASIYACLPNNQLFLRISCQK
jgi:hypothetical protein